MTTMTAEIYGRNGGPLTTLGIQALGAIFDGVAGSAKCRRLTEAGDIIEGTLRYLTGPDGGPRPDDIRDCHVRVTSRTGWEHFWPVLELADQWRIGEFVIDR